MNRGYCALGLDRPKNNINVGNALRACGVYGAAFLAISGDRMPFKYRSAPSDTQCAFRRMPLISVADLHSIIPFDCVPVAVEIVDGAIPLPTYKHPERAFYIFGPEDGSVSKDILKWCCDVVYIPTSGCMNLAATVNVVLYDRMVKAERGDFRKGNR